MAAAHVTAGTPELATPTIGRYSAAALAELRAERFDPEALAARDHANSALDELTIETILRGSLTVGCSVVTGVAGPDTAPDGRGSIDLGVPGN